MTDRRHPNSTPPQSSPQDENYGVMTCAVKFPAKAFGQGGFRAVVEAQCERYKESFPVKSWAWPGDAGPMEKAGARLRMTFKVRNGKTDRMDTQGKPVYETYLEPIAIEPLDEPAAAPPAAQAPRPAAVAPNPDDDLPF